MEIERKFKLGKIPDLTKITPHHITQGYISITSEIRIRKDNNNPNKII